MTIPKLAHRMGPSSARLHQLVCRGLSCQCTLYIIKFTWKKAHQSHKVTRRCSSRNARALLQGIVHLKSLSASRYNLSRYLLVCDPPTTPPTTSAHRHAASRHRRLFTWKMRLAMMNVREELNDRAPPAPSAALRLGQSRNHRHNLSGLYGSAPCLARRHAPHAKGSSGRIRRRRARSSMRRVTAAQRRRAGASGLSPQCHKSHPRLAAAVEAEAVVVARDK